MKHASPPVLAVDPGTTGSAYVLYEAGLILRCQKLPNHELLEMLRRWSAIEPPPTPTLVVEMVASYGMPVGKEVFETCLWVGRFIEAWESWHRPWGLLYRQDVKLHLCKSARANDATIRQSLLDKFGGKSAIGTAKKQGPLYDIHGDMWSALAVAVCWAEQHKGTNE